MTIEKLMFGMVAIRKLAGDDDDRAVAFTLLLSPTVADRAKANPRWLLDSMVRKVGGTTVPMAMAFGVSDNGVLHIHGGFAARDAADRERILASLRAAAGPWAANRYAARQLMTKPLGGASGPPEGWGSYVCRGDNLQAAEAVTDARPLWTMTNSARRQAKNIHSDVRRQIAAARGKGDATNEAIHAPM